MSSPDDFPPTQDDPRSQEPRWDPSDTPLAPSSSSFTPPPSAKAAAEAAAAAGALPLAGGLEHAIRELVADRRRERRWRVFFRLMWLGLFALGMGVFAISRQHMVSPKGPYTGLVEVRGEIAADTEASAELLVGALKNAFEDESAKAVVLRINSPGGSPVQAGIVHDEIKRLKGLHDKKVYAVVEEVCASGAYYIAAAADEIYVDKASIVGSIGVLMNGFGFLGLMDKMGVERRLMTAGENKGIGDPFSPVTDQQKAYIQAMLDQIHQQFITVVKEGRGKRLKESPEMFSGLFWNGAQAIELGLADKLGNLDYVAREVVKAEEVVDYTSKEGVAERIVKRFGVSLGGGAVRALQQGMSGLR